MQQLRGRTLGILSMLIIQFLLGMAVNLFITLTRHHPGANPPEYFSGSVQSVFWALTQGPILLILHVILGLLLFITSIVLVVQSFRLPGAALRVLAILGFVGILGAGFNGASFLNYNQNFSSYLMSVGFALAAVVYTQILFILPSAP